MPGKQGKRKYPKEFNCINCNRSFTKYFEYGKVAVKGECVWCGVTDEEVRQRAEIFKRQTPDHFMTVDPQYPALPKKYLEERSEAKNI